MSTGRLPFDPRKMRPGKAARGAEGARDPSAPAARAASQAPDPAADALTVSQLAARIAGALQTLPTRLRVVGEISGFRDRTHFYFDLKDAGAVVNCVVFASAARKLGFTPENGQEVVATGRVDFYAPGGKVSLLIDRLEPVGAGALELRFRALCEELRALGFFDPARKRPLPTFPRRIAVVTSRTGAALQDVIDTMRRRCPAVGLLVVDARVQGDGAAPEIVRAIDAINAHAERLAVDAILVTRGGGSMEDLWAFNERAVADAILRSRLPVVAAIGHETDTTIAELVADERCATPTQAAMRLTPDRAALAEQTAALSRRLARAMRSTLRHERQRLAACARRESMTRPARLIDTRRERLAASSAALARTTRALFLVEHTRINRLAVRLERARPAALHARRDERLRSLSARLHRAARALHRAATDRVEALARELDAVGPQRVLARGYSVTLDEAGSAVRSAAGLRPGQRLTTRLAEGEVRSTVDGSAAGTLGPAPGPVARPRRTRDDRRQMDLFAGPG